MTNLHVIRDQREEGEVGVGARVLDEAMGVLERAKGCKRRQIDGAWRGRKGR